MYLAYEELSALIEEKLGYCFNDNQLLEQAFTHCSANIGKDNKGKARHYERLEFLGDRVLNLCVAAALYKAYPLDTEGELAKRHTALIREEFLANLAKELGFGEYIRMSEGELRSGGQKKSSILSDVVESVFGAIYMESGTSKVEKLIECYWTPMFEQVVLQDAKSSLQEHLQAQKMEIPTYEVIEEEGKDHQPIFTVKVMCGLGNAIGTGASKQIAGQQAASALLVKIEKENL